MRATVMVLVLFASSVCSGAPITYFFSGYTTGIWVNNGEYDPLTPILNAKGTVVTNGQPEIVGKIVFDPSAWRDGAGGSGQGEVFSWTCQTQGLEYYGAGGAFHYLEFAENSFSYLDEIPQGGYGPDVAGLQFNFDNGPFADGPVHFPIDNFVGGHFSTAVETGWISEELSMQGLHGVITHLWAAPTPVPTPSSLTLLVAGLIMLGTWQIKRTGNLGKVTQLR